MSIAIVTFIVIFGWFVWADKRRDRKTRKHIKKRVEEGVWTEGHDSFETVTVERRHMNIWWPECPIKYLTWRADRYESVWRLRYGFVHEGAIHIFDNAVAAARYADRNEALTDFRKTIQLSVEAACS